MHAAGSLIPQVSALCAIKMLAFSWINWMSLLCQVCGCNMLKPFAKQMQIHVVPTALHLTPSPSSQSYLYAWHVEAAWNNAWSSNGSCQTEALVTGDMFITSRPDFSRCPPEMPVISEGNVPGPPKWQLECVNGGRLAPCS